MKENLFSLIDLVVYSHEIQIKIGLTGPVHIAIQT